MDSGQVMFGKEEEKSDSHSNQGECFRKTFSWGEANPKGEFKVLTEERTGAPLTIKYAHFSVFILARLLLLM